MEYHKSIIIYHKKIVIGAGLEQDKNFKDEMKITFFSI